MLVNNYERCFYMENNLIPYQPVIFDIKNLITVGQNAAYNAANRAMIMTYWTIGKRIIEEEQSGAERAEYGKRLIQVLSAALTKEFGNSYSSRNLHYYRKFYQYFPDSEILNTRVQNLNWSHFRALLRVPDEDARIWYMNEAANENWSVQYIGARPHKVMRISEALAAGGGADAPGIFAAWLSRQVPMHAFVMPGNRYDVGE